MPLQRENCATAIEKRWGKTMTDMKIFANFAANL
jgi:hypothetical protein